MTCMNIPNNIHPTIFSNFLHSVLTSFIYVLGCLYIPVYYSHFIGWYGTAQRQRHKCTQLFCNLRVRIKSNECVLSMRTSLDFRIL